MNSNRIITVSNALTFIRLLLTPLVVSALVLEYWMLAFVTFLIAAGTDLLDGFLARILNEQTHFGAALDPVADKIFVISSFAAMIFSKNSLFKLPLWFFSFLVIRESIILIGVFFAWIYTLNVKVQPTFLGKVSACSQMLFVLWLFVSHFYSWKFYYVNEYAIFLLAALSLVSFIQYFIAGLNYLYHRF